MYEYLQALHQRFFNEPEHSETRKEIENLRQSLETALEPSAHILLLRLLDAQSSLKNDISLESFTAGFKLASGIAKELEADGLYSYDAEVEEQMEGSNR